ncbi:hypothetical protein [Methanoculleus formosensis]|jgi:high-affinity Fe2+/Pb2+ permease|nr:hypothetical protein [Methanoculleus sp. Afa-1]
MNLRVLEVLAAFGCLALFVVLLVTLPDLVEETMKGFAYIIALIVFIAALSTAGLLIDKKVA